MTGDPPPEADRVDGAPHPRETARLLGQSLAEDAFLAAHAGGRMHHAWLVTGPRGVGKATLAWRIARFLLAEAPADAGGGAGLFGDAPPAPATLDIAADHPVIRRMAALSEPRLFLLRRAWDADKKRLKTVITVDEVRRLKSFFGLSATDGGRRVVIVDAADEMNINAANALLKLLEEPPANTVMLLVSHQPAGLLPTIRSRCRELRCRALDPADMAGALAAAGADPAGDAAPLAELSGGSVGASLRLMRMDGLSIYGALARLIAGAPRMDRPAAIAFAEQAAGRGAEDRFALMIELFDLLLARLARAGAAGPPAIEAAPGEAELFAQLAPNAGAARGWAALHEELGQRLRHGRAVNLDPSALILDTVLRINDHAGRLAASGAR